MRSRVQWLSLDHKVLRLFGALLIAIVFPAGLLYQDVGRQAATESFQDAVFGAVLAMIAGAYLLDQLARFPGLRQVLLVVPVFASTFGCAAVLLLFLRLDYARAVFGASFTLTCAWYILVPLVVQRRRHLRFAVVPGGEVRRVATLPDVAFDGLELPLLPAGRCDGVVVDLRADLDIVWERFIADCALAGVPIYHFKQLTESLTGRVEIEHLSENNLGSLAPNFAYSMVKWALDAAIAALLLFLMSPLMALTALIIRLDSPGPAFFRQPRVGFRGERFTVFKFRTMCAGPAREGRDAAITQQHDPRITRVGRFLRRYRVDELPQLINVLRGEMSLIGPRPEAVPLAEWYEDQIPYYPYRHIVKPGISGWAQVMQGHVAQVDAVRDKLHYDFFYIKNYSPWLDLIITLRTILVLFSGFGSK